jgi:hypothetical protein
VHGSLAQELLLPTPANLNPIHVPRSDLLQFLRVQQWVEANLHLKLPLLNGMFALVPSGSLQQQQRGCSGSSDSSTMAARTTCCLRQVSAVEVSPGVDPADATVVLVGGDRVRAGAVHEGQLADVPDHQVGKLGFELLILRRDKPACPFPATVDQGLHMRLTIRCAEPWQAYCLFSTAGEQ